MNMCRIFMILVTSALCAQAGLDHAQIERAKAATALVISPKNDDALGSAFCIDTMGYFITSRDVVQKSDDGTVTLVLHPDGPEERRLSARVVRDDETLNLALLKAEQAVGAALPLGEDAGVQEQVTFVAFGYSFPRLFSRHPDGFPTIDVNTGRITSLRRESGMLRLFRIDAELNPGNVGGPLLDDEGLVIGVVSSPRNDFYGEVMPVGRVHTLLRKPLLRAEFPATAPWSDRYIPRQFKVALDMFSTGTPPDEVSLTLDDGETARLLHAEKTATGYLFEASLLPDKGASKIKLRLTLPDAELLCLAEDLTLADGVRLAELDGYEKDKGFLTPDGKAIPVDGSREKLLIYLAGQPVEIPIDKLEAFSVEPTKAPTFVHYRIAAATKGVACASLEGNIHFSKAHDSAESPSSVRDDIGATDMLTHRAPKAFLDTIERPLPAPITDVTPAGSGRFLLLRMDKVEQIAVFDVLELKFVKFIPLPEPKTLVAGGASSFVLVLPEQDLIQRWSLETFEPELTKMLPEAGIMLDIGMGYGSKGPLLARTSLDTSQVNFFDLETCEPIPHLSKVKAPVRTGDLMSFRFSADGRTICMWSNSTAPSGLNVLRLSGKKPMLKSEHDSAGYILPDMKGEYVYTMNGLRTFDLVNVVSPEKTMTVPSTLPAYFVGMERLGNAHPSDPSNVRLSLFVTGQAQPLARLPETPELLIPTRKYGNKDMSADQYIHFVPQAKVLVTLPAERDRVVVRYVDIDEYLNKTEQDYFFVDSVPPDHVEQGGHFRYAINARSKTPIAKYTLSSAPEGMEITRDGRLYWNVPTDFEGRTSVIVHLRNRKNEELFHSFSITVTP